MPWPRCLQNILWAPLIKSTGQTFLARLLYVLGPILFGLILIICIMVILFHPYFIMKQVVRNAPGVQRVSRRTCLHAGRAGAIDVAACRV